VPHFVLDAVSLYDAGFGPAIVSVTAPGGTIAPPPRCGNLTKKDMGKAPGVLTLDGWVPYDLRKDACQDRTWAFVIRDQWGGNVGIRGGLPLGLGWIDNDQGEEFSQAIQTVFAAHNLSVPRRFVLSPKHHHDAFLFRLVDFVSAPVECPNREMKFAKGVNAANFQVLGHAKHAVAGGVHSKTLQPYVWDREITDITDIPEIEVNEWGIILHEIVLALNSLGWVTRSGTVPAVPASMGGMGGSTPGVTLSTPDEVRELLHWLPNDGSGSKELADFLDNVDNYLDMGYAIYGALGATAEAQAIWLGWAHQHPQNPPDHPETRWRSIINQTPRSGVLHLVGVANRFAGGRRAASLFAAAPEIPDIKSTQDLAWEKIKKDWVFCSAQDAYIRLSDMTIHSRSAFNSLLAPLVPEVYIAVKGTGLKKRQHAPRMNELFDIHPDAEKVRNLVYAPGDASFVGAGSKRDLNTWSASSHGVIAGVTEAQVQPWLDHVEFVLGSRVERDRFLRWNAFAIQCPEKKANWHWIVMSKEGLGKDTMFRPVKLAIGPDNFADISVFELTREFNHYAERKMLVIGETKQVSNATTNAHDIYAVRLKPLLAAPPDEITVNMKNRREYRVPNRHAVFMFSNEFNPLHLGDHSRRVHVIDRMGEAAKPQSYYEKIVAELDAGLDELAASYLRSYPLPTGIENEMRGVAPLSSAQQHLLALNRDPLRDVIEEMVDDARDGDGPFACLLADAKDIMEHVKRQGFQHVNTQRVSGVLTLIEGVKAVKPKPGRVTPEPIRTTINGQTVSGRLWQLGDMTHDGKNLNTMTWPQLLALWANKPLPKGATVTPLVRAKLAAVPVSAPEFKVDPEEEV